MTRSRFVSLLFFFAFFFFTTRPLLAQGTDFAVEIDAAARQPLLATTFVVHASWTGQEPAKDVTLEVDLPGQIVALHQWDAGTRCTEGRPIRCTMPSAASYDGGFSVTTSFPAPATYAITARIASTTPDPHPENNTVTRSIDIAGLPSLRPYASASLLEGDAVDPGGPGGLRIGIQNDGETATNVILRATLPEGGRFTEADRGDGSLCSVTTPAEVVCRLGTLRDFAVRQILVKLIAPDREGGGTVPFVVTAEADEEDYDASDDTRRGEMVLRRLFAVTSPADEGAGTLRQAMLDAEVFCLDKPCLIAARAPEAMVIQPRSPLPVLHGRVKLDGGAARTTLDGALLAESGALRYENGCEFRLTAFAIRNFKGHAIEASRDVDARTSCGSSLALTPATITHNELTGNLRGIVTRGVSATITDNLIRDHVRAGIFADQAYFTEIARNEITGNGASGVFLNASGNDFYLPAGAEVFANIIRGNGEWGVARTANGSVHVYSNSISGNNLYGLDIGLDLDSPRTPLKPVLFSAVYRPDLDATVIRGSVGLRADGGPDQINLYGSTSLSRWGYPEAESPIGDAYRDGDFEISVPGDLRGKWITATGSRTTYILFLRPPAPRARARTQSEPPPSAEYRYQSYDTSELSNAVKVQ